MKIRAMNTHVTTIHTCCTCNEPCQWIAKIPEAKVGLSQLWSGRIFAFLVERREDKVELRPCAKRRYRKHTSGDNHHAESDIIYQLDQAVRAMTQLLGRLDFFFFFIVIILVAPTLSALLRALLACRAQGDVRVVFSRTIRASLVSCFLSSNGKARHERRPLIGCRSSVLQRIRSVRLRGRSRRRLLILLIPDCRASIHRRQELHCSVCLPC